MFWCPTSLVSSRSATKGRRGENSHKKDIFMCYNRKEIITVRGQSYVSRLPKYWPSIAPSAGGGYTLAGRRGGWGVNILEDERHRIALTVIISLRLQYRGSLNGCNTKQCFHLAAPQRRILQWLRHKTPFTERCIYNKWGLEQGHILYRYRSKIQNGRH